VAANRRLAPGSAGETCRPVAQVSKPAVSPTSKSAGCWKTRCPRVWKPATQQTCPSPLRFDATAPKPEAKAGKSALRWLCQDAPGQIYLMTNSCLFVFIHPSQYCYGGRVEFRISCGFRPSDFGLCLQRVREKFKVALGAGKNRDQWRRTEDWLPGAPASRRPVAQVSKPAVSPTSKSAGCWKTRCPRVWKPATQQTCPSPLRFDATAPKPEAKAGKSALRWLCQDAPVSSHPTKIRVHSCSSTLRSVATEDGFVVKFFA
jgi:hypothetical protein